MSAPSDAQVQSLLQQEMQAAALQEFYSTLRDKCWDKCITKPSSSLSSSEQQCLARCCDRYAEVRSSRSQNDSDPLLAGPIQKTSILSSAACNSNCYAFHTQYCTRRDELALAASTADVGQAFVQACSAERGVCHCTAACLSAYN